MKIGPQGGRGQAQGVGKPLDLRRDGRVPRAPLDGKGGCKKTRQRGHRYRAHLSSLSRDGRIRTGDPLNPIQVRYRAAPRPEGR
jgi:hypothetical protein